MFKNYEKQLQYDSIYNEKYNIKNLTISLIGTNISSINERNFFILSNKKKIFEKKLNKLKINNTNKIYQISKILKNYIRIK